MTSPLWREVLHIGIVGPVLARRDVEARGLHVVPGFPVEGVHGRIAFLEPEPTSGLTTELCEVR